MSRKALIKELEKGLKARVVCYITGDRHPFSTRIAPDIIPQLSRQLEAFGKVERIALFLYTTGGDMLAPIRIVKLIRHHCSSFDVVVPYKAHSAGTLIALGADTILMGKLGELTPVDPSTGHPFNPQNPTNPQQQLEISVEDLNSYFLFAKEKAGVKNEDMVEVYKMLVEKLHPLSIGNAYRAFRMVNLLTERLLGLHMKGTDSQTPEKMRAIIKAFTSDITIHAYPIDRDEALGLGLKIERPDDLTDKAMNNLFQSFADQMKLMKPFHPIELLGGKDLADIDCVGACLESTEHTYFFKFRGQVKKVIRNNQETFDLNMPSQAWEEQTEAGQQ